ncbi:uncharacterized protein LOC130405542 isoform X3 [Gadus chalcogrammus]|uniref:uncharacterized protein LOC130405542 isoform X3 n=1 Tax=Gadus chalcogrammus TaxID=1042646 RepID=UPI0024C48DF8|nr:uncharacterized protein LOC130405542 isoform X3 [Gadus chalcogrammus]
MHFRHLFKGGTISTCRRCALTTALGHDKTVVKPKKQTRGDNKTLSAGRDLSGKLLQDVAKSLGCRWEQAAHHLGLKKRDLDEIKKDNKDEFMQRRNMLRLWMDQRPGKATAQDLLRGLEGLEDLPVETRRLLKEASVEIDEDDKDDEGEQSQGRKSSHSGTSLTEDTASMSVVDRCEEDCSDSGLRSKPVKKPSHSSGPGSRPGELSSSLPLKMPASNGILALGDDKTVVKPKKQTRARNNETLSAGRDLSGKLLQDVAKSLGCRWEQAAHHLGLKKRDLDEIKKDNKDEFMQRRNMLRLWMDQRPGKATAQDLLRGLEGLEDLPVETRRLLKEASVEIDEDDKDDEGEQSQGRKSSHSGTSLTEDTASMSVVDRCEEDCSDSGLRSKPVKKPSHSSGPGSRPGELSSSLPLKMPASNGILALGDDKTVVKPKKQTRARNNETLSAGRDLSGKLLQDVAKSLGCRWEQAAHHLGLKKRDLDEIKKDNKDEFMQRRNMLRLWMDQRPGKATAQDLLRGLEGLEDLPVETRRLLKEASVEIDEDDKDDEGEQSQGRKSSHSGTSLTEDTASMSVVDRCEEDCSDSGLRSKPVKKPSHSSGPGSRPGELSSSLPLKMPASNGILALGDDKTVVKPKKQTRARNNETLSAGRDLSGKLLQDVAKSLGCRWEQAAHHLGLKKRDLDEIKKDNKDEFMQRRNMLRLWMDQRPGKATAQDLLRGLEGLEDLPVETRRLLKDLLPKMESSSSGTSLTEDTASMPVVDGCGEEDCSDSGEQSQGRKSIHSGTSLTEDIASISLTDGHEEEDCSDSDASAEIDEEDEGTSLTEDIASRFLMDRSEEEDCSDSDAIAEIDEDDEDDEGTSLTEDTASMPVVDRCEEEDCSDSGASAEIDEDDEDDEDDEEEMHIKSQHEKCTAAQQSPEYVKVTPTKILKCRFKLPLKGKGTYECSATGLVFEVSEQALVRYSVLSWSEIAEFLPDSWRPAGSIWNVDVVNNDSSVLKFIHFPHSLCLSGPEHELSFSVLLVKDGQASIKSKLDFTASHVKWPVSSLSKVGPITPSSLQGKHHGRVLIYKEQKRKCRNDHIFRVFLSLNNDSEIKALEEKVLENGEEWIKVAIPPLCLLKEKVYHLKSEPKGQIEEKNPGFTTAVLASKGSFVVHFSALERPPFRLSLMDSDCDEPLWSATIREEDWKGKKSSLPKMNQVANNRGRGEQSQGQKSSQSELLRKIRSQFVQGVSNPVIKGLLDDLYTLEVVGTEEKEFVMENQKIKTDMARCLIDMVIGKGETASRIMIDSMKVKDKYLCSDLGLIPSPAAAAE